MVIHLDHRNQNLYLGLENGIKMFRENFVHSSYIGIGNPIQFYSSWQVFIFLHKISKRFGISTKRHFYLFNVVCNEN